MGSYVIFPDVLNRGSLLALPQAQRGAVAEASTDALLPGGVSVSGVCPIRFWRKWNRGHHVSPQCSKQQGEPRSDRQQHTRCARRPAGSSADCYARPSPTHVGGGLLRFLAVVARDKPRVCNRRGSRRGKCRDRDTGGRRWGGERGSSRNPATSTGCRGTPNTSNRNACPGVTSCYRAASTT